MTSSDAHLGEKDGKSLRLRTEISIVELFKRLQTLNNYSRTMREVVRAVREELPIIIHVGPGLFGFSRLSASQERSTVTAGVRALGHVPER